jgi:hypothetical protein
MIRGILRHEPSASGDARNASLPTPIPLSFVLLSSELPRGALAIVQVRPRRLEQTFIILSEQNLSDVIIRRARLAALVYAVRHPDDKGTVEFTLLPDGQLETRSASRGAELGSHIPTAERTSGKNQVVADLLKHASTVVPSDYPGFGRARVVNLVDSGA